VSRQVVRHLRTFSALVVIVVGCAFAQPGQARERDWQPQRTWVFVVGVLKWQHRDLFNSFPQTNRRDSQLVQYFREQGVPEDQIVFLKDGEATSRRVHRDFPSFLSKAKPGDLLFFYYTGHGYKSDDESSTYFATYDAGQNVEGWATDAIVRDIEKYFRGSRALLTADTCYSGSLAAQAQRLGRRLSYASLTSSSSKQESTGNWTFTEMLLAGLRGKSFADANNDGEVTLTELAEDIRQDMAFAESQRSTFITSNDFPAQMIVSSAARKADPLISLRAEVRSEGDWYKGRVIDAGGGRYLVHFYGYEDTDDEWVIAKHIRRTKADVTAARVEASWQNPSEVRTPHATEKWNGAGTSNGSWNDSPGPNRNSSRRN
jgi:Caspase domain